MATHPKEFSVQMGGHGGPPLHTKSMLTVQVENNVARVTLNRPEVHNAFNDELVSQLTTAFKDLGSRDDVRAIILAGAGKSFCAGADLNWMKRMVHYTSEQNLEDARKVGHMFLTIARCPRPVIARIHGAALAGGSGLVAASDIAVAVEAATFGFTETKLGILPAVISPFVISKIGQGRTREFFITGEQFSASVARDIGLIHYVVPDETTMDRLIESKLAQIRTSAPKALAAVKELVFAVTSKNLEAALEYAAGAIARARTGQEGQAGMKAFLEKTKPPWVEQ